MIKIFKQNTVYMYLIYLVSVYQPKNTNWILITNLYVYSNAMALLVSVQCTYGKTIIDEYHCQIPFINIVDQITEVYKWNSDISSQILPILKKTCNQHQITKIIFN